MNAPIKTCLADCHDLTRLLEHSEIDVLADPTQLIDVGLIHSVFIRLGKHLGAITDAEVEEWAKKRQMPKTAAWMKDNNFAQPAEKPPLGLKPRAIHEWDRQKDIVSAMMRYTDAVKPIPKEWVEELLALSNP